MLTVDEASSYIGLASTLATPFFAMVRERPVVRSPGATGSSGFFSRAALAAIFVGIGSMAISAVGYHLLVWNQYNHMAIAVWSLAVVAILIAATASSAVATALLSLRSRS
jgi:hypothetical protein